MNKKQIISVFLKEGVMVPPTLLETINEDNYEDILRELKEGKKEKPKIKTENKKKRKEATVKDFLDYYGKKYEILKGVLLKKMDAVSINKGKKIFSKTSIIGRVREKTKNGFVIEDITGGTEVVMDNKNILPGDIVGLRGWFKEGGFFPDEIIWPDIPLTDKGKIPDILLTRKLSEELKEKTGKGFAVINLESEENGNLNPRWIRLQHGGKETLILVFKPEDVIGNQEFVNFLKRRELPHREEAGIYTPYLIENIPNIIWLIENKENWSKNYKGIVVASTDHESFFEYSEINGGKFGKI
ncbi:MAG: hypothetical protein GTN76_12435 [Candidatus Aenigmarchaeota archaeon]|nr:hypothetical protein [Candidatus Aenigmarchaeota archaeon]